MAAHRRARAARSPFHRPRPRGAGPPPLAPRGRLASPSALVEQRRRRVGDTVRLTHRLTSTLKNSFPHVLHWLEDQDTPICCACLAPGPTLQAAQRARRTTLERFFRAHHVRYTNVIDTRIQAIKNAIPLTTAEGVIAPPALLVQALVAQLRVLLHAIADFDHAMAQRAQSHPDFPLFAALPGAGAVFAPRLAVRALAFKGIRILWRCWQDHTPSVASVYLDALKHRGSPLLHTLAH